MKTVVLLILAFCLVGVTGPLPMTRSLERKVDLAATRAIAAQNIPGLSIAIAENGRVVYARGYGLREVGDRLPVDEKTTFRIGSITKQFTAAAVMLLVQEGKVRLDDRLSSYLPDAPFADRVTIRELLSHTSGVPDYTVPETFDAASKFPITPAGIVASVSGEPLGFTPGTKWEYSNTNYILLGMLVEKVAKQPYESFVQDHLLKPLGLGSMSFWNQLLVYRDASIGYSTVPFEPALHTVDWNWDWAGAAGGINGDAADLARWDVALDSGRVVTPASFALMSAPQKLADGTSTGYGFGLGIATLANRKVVWHDGGVPGFITMNYTIPKDRVAIVVFANSDSAQPGAVADAVLYAIYGVKPPAPKLKTIAESSAQLKRARLALTASLTGKLSTMRLRPDFARSMRGVVADQYADLGRRLGSLASLQLIGTDMRPPVTTYYYKATFSHAVLLYTFVTSTDGTIAGIGIQRWAAN